jgi:UPF0176 protein
MKKIIVCALYKFVALEDYEALRAPLFDFLSERGIRGTLLLAEEGINGTVAGSRQAIHEMLDYLQSDPRLSPLDYKESYDDTNPFYRTKVRLKKEIVTLGVTGIDPRSCVGTYVEPKEWNALISDPDVLLIDTRNEYEIGVGTFRNAVNPHTDSFREFPAYVAENLKPKKHRKVAMFCTGGIRCEKSTAFLKEQGFDEVYHLKGGILKYLEEVPEEESMWEGECFVFDNRVAVGHNLKKGNYDQCHACRMPITEEEKLSPHYEKGVSCPHCHDKYSSQRKIRFKERERQIRLARKRNEDHLGADAVLTAKKRRELKRLEKEAASAQQSKKHSKAGAE